MPPTSGSSSRASSPGRGRWPGSSAPGARRDDRRDRRRRPPEPAPAPERGRADRGAARDGDRARRVRPGPAPARRARAGRDARGQPLDGARGAPAAGRDRVRQDPPGPKRRRGRPGRLGPGTAEMVERTLAPNWEYFELLFDLRRLIEQQIARTAAERLEDGHVADIEATRDRYRDAGSDRE